LVPPEVPAVRPPVSRRQAAPDPDHRRL